jgi:hypothetical protein
MLLEVVEVKLTTGLPLPSDALTGIVAINSSAKTTSRYETPIKNMKIKITCTI